MVSNVQWRKWGKWVQLAGAAGLFFFAWMTLHDMQTAEGTGLYLMFLAGADERKGFDCLVEGVSMLCFLAAVVAPAVWMKRCNPGFLLRFLCAYLAFLPTVSTASVVHLLDGTDRIRLGQTLLEGQGGLVLLEGLDGLIPVLGAGVPLLLLASAALASGEEAGRPACLFHRRKAMWAVLFLLLAAALLFPALTNHCHYLFCYCLLVYGCGIWEKLLERFPGLKGFSWLLAGIFCARGIDRMMEIMSVYHI